MVVLVGFTATEPASVVVEREKLPVSAVIPTDEALFTDHESVAVAPARI